MEMFTGEFEGDIGRMKQYLYQDMLEYFENESTNEDTPLEDECVFVWVKFVDEYNPVIFPVSSKAKLLFTLVRAWYGLKVELYRQSDLIETKIRLREDDNLEILQDGDIINVKLPHFNESQYK